MRRQQVLSLGIALIVSLAGANAHATEDEAVDAARSWLGLVDAGDYTASWQAAAELFRKAVSEQEWVRAASAVREPLGSVKTRVLGSAQYSTSLPGAPDGEYVVIRFESSFEHKDSAIETVIPTKDPDGEWRVSGYFIK